MKIGNIKAVKDYNQKNFQDPVGFKLEIFDEDPEILEVLKSKISEMLQ